MTARKLAQPPRLLATLLALVLVAGAAWAAPAEDGAKPSVDARSAPPNLPLRTLGGRQFWADRFVYAGWRIQQHVYSGHHRLIDPQDIRRAWGSYAAVRAAFEEIRASQGIAPASGHLVLLLHGLGRTSKSFPDLAAALRAEGYEVVAISYPSTRRDVAAQAADLGEILDRLEDIEQVSFVTHSLGSFVVRKLLSQRDRFDSGVTLSRAVLIAPPSQGAALADRLQDFPPYRWIAGPAGQELTSAAAAELPAPAIPFGVIAGGCGGPQGYNPLLAGDDDGVVAVSETRLEGAADFLVVPEIHTFIANHPATIEAVLRFLATGRFGKAPSSPSTGALPTEPHSDGRSDWPWKPCS